jgi:hypothetical protein
MAFLLQPKHRQKILISGICILYISFQKNGRSSKVAALTAPQFLIRYSPLTILWENCSGLFSS